MNCWSCGDDIDPLFLHWKVVNVSVPNDFIDLPLCDKCVKLIDPRYKDGDKK